LEVRIPKSVQEVSELAQEAVDGEFDVLLAGGGDGTLHQVTQTLAESASSQRPVLGQLPFGSGNDFLRQFDFHRLADKNFDRLLDGSLKWIDLGQCAEKWFVNGAGFGLAADVGREFEDSGRSGALAYLISSLKTIGLHKATSIKVQVDDVSFEGPSSLVAVGNGPFSGGGFRLTPEAKPDDGLMDVCIVRECSRRTLFRCFPASRSGKHTRLPIVVMLRGRKMLLESDVPLHAQLDGEILPPRNKWSLSLKPSAIPFLVPLSLDS